jgi:hypothetical protein
MSVCVFRWANSALSTNIRSSMFDGLKEKTFMSKIKLILTFDLLSNKKNDFFRHITKIFEYLVAGKQHNACDNYKFY